MTSAPKSQRSLSRQHIVTNTDKLFHTTQHIAKMVCIIGLVVRRIKFIHTGERIHT